MSAGCAGVVGLFFGCVAKSVFCPHRTDFLGRSNVAAFDLGFRLSEVSLFLWRQLNGWLARHAQQ